MWMGTLWDFIIFCWGVIFLTQKRVIWKGLGARLTRLRQPSTEKKTSTINEEERSRFGLFLPCRLFDC